MTRRLYLILLMALMAVTGFAQQPQTGDMIYVYLKGGDILPFQRAEITEFNYGFEDEEGVTHDKPVMQWIVLEDSICKVPLANIDSISFVTPPTVYQPGVIRLEQELMPYVEKSDSLTIFFAANTPANLLPKVGDKLVTVETNDKLPYGFVGKVKAVNGTTVECESIALGDVFETYYCTYETSAGSDIPTNARTRADGTPFQKTFNLPEVTYNSTTDIALKIFGIEGLALQGSNECIVKVKPTITVKSSFIVNGLNTTIDLGIRGDFDLTESYGFYGGLEYKPDIAPPTDFAICSLAPGVILYWKPGIYLQFALMSSVKGIAKQHLVTERTFHASLKKGVIDNCNAKITSSDFEVEGCLSGTMGIGGFIELGVTGLCSNLDKICLRGELGLEVVGDLVLYNKDITEASKSYKVYETLKSSSISANVVLNTMIVAEAPLFSVTKHTPLVYTWPVGKKGLVPTFEDVEFEQRYSPRTSADVRMTIKGDCYFPVKTGFKITEESGKEISTTFASEPYRKGGRRWTAEATGLEDDGDYVLNPVVKFLGFDILASPSVAITKNPFPVSIINFEQTGAKYSKQKGYEYDGRNYFYKFNARTTVELAEGVDNVKDWGYVYVDIYGEHKKISCANLTGRNYADERYAYYYNEPQRSVKLYPYIQFEGESDIQKGILKIYEVEFDLESMGSCPDNNHPHAIDLGLSSGTKWSCCNVGADSPDAPGGHYAWGCLNEVTSGEYPYYVDKQYVYIGDDIGGTEYDVAHETWGGAWRMPTRSQLMELDSQCTKVWVPFGGPSSPGGFRFIGPNGKSIVLPLAGEKLYDYLIPWIDPYEEEGYVVNYGKSEREAVHDESFEDSRGKWHESYVYNGHYWSSTFDKDSESYCLTMRTRYLNSPNSDNNLDPNDDEEKSFYNINDNRYLLKSVRPVMKQK